MMQQAGRVGRLIANDKLSYENKPSSSLNKKKSDRRYDRSVSYDEFFDDNEENEYPMYRPNSSNQLKVPSRTDDSERELSRRPLKLAVRDVSKENYYLSGDEDVKMKSKHDSRRKWSDWRDVSPERYYSSKTHHHSNHRSSGRMKPEKFDGSTCFETFLVQFNNCAQFNRWDDMDKLHYLRWTLTGPAAQMLWGTEGMSYCQLIARLRSRFGSQEMEEKYQAELQCRRRNAGESLRELAQDIRRLMILAYSDDRSPMSERLAKEHFIAAIDEPELELKVREKEPQTLDAALKYAQRLEIYKNAVRQRRQRFARMVTASPDSRSSSPERRIAKGDRSQQKPRQQRDEPPKRSRQKDNNSRQLNTNEKREGRNDNTRTCATTMSNDEKWKDELLKKVQDLELNQQKLNAEN